MKKYIISLILIGSISLMHAQPQSLYDEYPESGPTLFEKAQEKYEPVKGKIKKAFQEKKDAYQQMSLDQKINLSEKIIGKLSQIQEQLESIPGQIDTFLDNNQRLPKVVVNKLNTIKQGAINLARKVGAFKKEKMKKRDELRIQEDQDELE